MVRTWRTCLWQNALISSWSLFDCLVSTALPNIHIIIKQTCDSEQNCPPPNCRQIDHIHGPSILSTVRLHHHINSFDRDTISITLPILRKTNCPPRYISTPQQLRPSCSPSILALTLHQYIRIRPIPASISFSPRPYYFSSSKHGCFHEDMPAPWAVRNRGCSERGLLGTMRDLGDNKSTSRRIV